MGRVAVDSPPTEQKKTATPTKPEDLVRAEFKDRSGWKLRISPLWTKGESSYFRVNYMNWDDWKLFESYWVVVNNGTIQIEKDVRPETE